MHRHSLQHDALRRFDYFVVFLCQNPWAAEDDEPAIRDAEKIKSEFESMQSDPSRYDEAGAYLSCVCQLANEGCPTEDALEALSEPYQLAFRRYDRSPLRSLCSADVLFDILSCCCIERMQAATCDGQVYIYA